MGSVVLDTVDSFFGYSPSHPQYVYRETPRAHNPSPRHQRSRTSSRAETPMSASGQRAPSSSAHNTPRDYAPVHPTPRATSQTAQRNASPPPSPSLAARPAPRPDGSARPATAQTGGTPSRIAPGGQQARKKIKVRDLEHIQSFASEHMSAFSELRSRSRSRSRGAEDEGPQYEISEMKVEHIIEMVAGLLTKITTTNDQQHEHLHRQPTHLESASHMNPTTSSVLAFHGKNVPSITILSYLSRINKYCPTSYEVFLSLLVYFDRMTERVNAGPMQSLRQATQHSSEYDGSRSNSNESVSSDKSDMMEGVAATPSQETQTATPPSSGSLEGKVSHGVPGTPHSRPHGDSPSIPPELSSADALNLSHFFVVDSFNIHRLVIAGVTCASKFFSDIFYTNSRYAKVGGLPLPELNHLELQFLLLNDFRLSVPVEEIEAYGTMLVEFYAREVVAQQKAAAAMSSRSLSESSTESTVTVRAAN